MGEQHDIGLDSAPHRREDATSVELDGELVVYAPDHGTVHKLDAIATALWHCLDGQVTLRELAGELAEAFATDRDRIEDDLVRYTGELVACGLAWLPDTGE